MEDASSDGSIAGSSRVSSGSSSDASSEAVRERSPSSSSSDATPVEGAREPKPLKRDVGTPLRQRSTGDTLTIPKEVAQVGDPQQREAKEYSIETILKELQAIQNTGSVSQSVSPSVDCYI